MNKKFLTMGLSGVAAIVAVLAVASIDTSLQTQEFVIGEVNIPEPIMNTVAASPLASPPKPIMKLVTHPVSNLDMGKDITKLNLSADINLPKGYAVEAVSAVPESKRMLLLLSDKTVSDNTTYRDFLNNGGVIITIKDLSESTVDRQEWENSWLEQNSGERITINGKTGVMHGIQNHSFEDGSIVTNPAKVVFYDENTMYLVKAILNTSDIIEIAKSL